jgi:UDP-GlcNAc:undecaprenyl-phosphate GlcNAc-1-phosphate transferase
MTHPMDFAIFPLTFLVSLFLIPVFRRPALRIGLVDQPGGRKVHDEHVPLVGGLGLFVAFALSVPLLEQDLNAYRGLFLGMGVLAVAGALDDLHELRARPRLLVQVAVAFLPILMGGLDIIHLGKVPGLGTIHLGPLSVPFTVLCIVGLINAVNMLDGEDGLAGGVILVMLGWLVVIALLGGAAQLAILPLILMGALLGFLVYNFPHPWQRQAKVFLGDSGSMLLGFALAWFAIQIGSEQGAHVPPVTIAWILALPVFDTVCLMIRRIQKGWSPLVADREHLHHIFQRAGFTDRGAVYVMAITTLAMGAVGVAGWQLGLPDWLMFAGLFVGLAFHYYFVQHAWRMVRALRRIHG